MHAETKRGREHAGARWWKRSLLVVAWLVLSYVGASVMFWQIERFAMQAYRIPSSAMEPTLHCPRPAHDCEADTADRVLALRLHPSWTPGRGDIVAFRTPPAAKEKCGAGGTFVKRIIGLPGETVSIRLQRGASYVYIDGQQLEEPSTENDRRDIGPEESFKVPAGHYFVMGDNHSQSCDSRVWGSVPEDNLTGEVVARYWPLDRIGSP